MERVYRIPFLAAIPIITQLVIPLHAQQLKMSDFEKSIVQIVIQKPDLSMTPVGTGFFVNEDGTVATAFHVYVSGLSAISQGRGGRFLMRRASRASQRYVWAAATIVKNDISHDLALFKMQEIKDAEWQSVGGIRPVKLSVATEIEPNTQVVVVGYFGADLFPLSLSARLVGATSVITSPGRAIEEFLVSASAVPGQSGSPVALEDGSVIGVITSIVPVSVPFNSQPIPSGLNRVIKVEHIQRLLLSK